MASNGYFTLGTFYFKRGLKNKPLLGFEKAKEIRGKMVGSDNLSVIDGDLNLIICLLEINRFDEGILKFKETEKKILNSIGNMNLKLYKLYTIISLVYKELHSFELADKFFQKAKKISSKLFTSQELMNGENENNGVGIIGKENDELARRRVLEEELEKELEVKLSKNYYNKFSTGFKAFEDIKKSTINI